MPDNAIVVEVREGVGKGVARKLRASGRVPAVCYAQGAPSLPVSLDPRPLDRLLARSTAGMNTLIDVQVRGDSEQREHYDGKKVMVKELQREPVTGDMLHVDLFAVDLTHVVQVSVPIHVHGTAHGVTMGGVLDQALRELELECMPTSIPEEFAVDVSGLDIGDSLHVSDLQLPEGVKLLSDPELPVVSVVSPSVAEEKEEAEEAEIAPEAEGAPGEAEGAPEGEDGEESSSE